MATDTMQKGASVTFVLYSSFLDPELDANSRAMEEIDNFLAAVAADTSLVITEMHLTGSASPEGPEMLNDTLAQKRLLALENFIIGGGR